MATLAMPPNIPFVVVAAALGVVLIKPYQLAVELSVVE